MVLLFPLKPVVLVLSLLGGLMLVSFLGESLLEGKQPFVTRGEARKIIVKQNTSRPTLETQSSDSRPFSPRPVELSVTAKKKTRNLGMQNLLFRRSYQQFHGFAAMMHIANPIQSKR